MKKEKLSEKSPQLVESPQDSANDLSVRSEDNELNKLLSKPRPKKDAVPFGERMHDLYSRTGKLLKEIDTPFEKMNLAEQDRYFERLSITFCVLGMCILSSFFYWHLTPIVRVLLVPIMIGIAWWFGAIVVPRLLTSEGRKQIFQTLTVVEYFQLVEAIKFSATTFIVATIPFWIMPSQLQVAISNPMARTIFLGAFIWNLIGAPLYAQAKSRKARLLIVFIFAVPAATVTLWWVDAIMLMGMYMYSM